MNHSTIQGPIKIWRVYSTLIFWSLKQLMISRNQINHLHIFKIVTFSKILKGLAKKWGLSGSLFIFILKYIVDNISMDDSKLVWWELWIFMWGRWNSIYFYIQMNNLKGYLLRPFKSGPILRSLINLIYLKFVILLEYQIRRTTFIEDFVNFIQ